jgi:hypothetical protein
MNVLAVLPIALFISGFGIGFYSRYISRQIGSDDKNPTPAISLNDGVDHVPTKTHVLFAHHFATIAGVGPIVGPVMGFVYGFVPVFGILMIEGFIVTTLDSAVRLNCYLFEELWNIPFSGKVPGDFHDPDHPGLAHLSSVQNLYSQRELDSGRDRCHFAALGPRGNNFGPENGVQAVEPKKIGQPTPDFTREKIISS